MVVVVTEVAGSDKRKTIFPMDLQQIWLPTYAHSHLLTACSLPDRSPLHPFDCFLWGKCVPTCRSDTSRRVKSPTYLPKKSLLFS